MNLASQQQYIDFDNQVSPLQSQFVDIIGEAVEISPFYKSKTEILVAQNEFNKFDNPWDLFKRQNETVEFLSVDKVDVRETIRLDAIQALGNPETHSFGLEIDFSVAIILSSNK